LFDVQTIDMRLPPLDDGISWPQLLTRYDVAGLYDSMALLKRAPIARAHTLTPLTSIAGKFGEKISVPATADGPIWAEIDVKLSPRGKLEELFYRPPGLLIEVQMAGENETYRLIAPIARAGFLLSPMLKTRGEFVSLASTAWREDLKSRVVRRIVISPVGFGKIANVDACFEPEIKIKFSRLEFSHQDLSGIPGWSKRLAPPDSASSDGTRSP
ncbi:MAG TPA: hypothetical protein VFC46_11505, partial [Humisphaera sp.]|nr:hypothetical protein [Humisphaera sp.]